MQAFQGAGRLTWRGDVMAMNDHTSVASGASSLVPVPAQRRRQLLIDATIALGLFTYSLVVALAFPPPPPHGWRGYVTVLTLTVLTLAGRRVWPRTTHVLVTGGMLVALLLQLPGAVSNSTMIAAMISTYSFAAYARTSRPWIGWPMAIAAIVVVAFKPGVQHTVIPITIVEMGMAWYFGMLQRQRASLATTLAHRALQLEASPDEAERLAVHHERGRIARDLQLLVTGAVETMVVGARGARAALHEDGGRAEELAVSTAETGRAALHEMRRLLELLRSRGGEQLPTTPDLGALSRLVDDATDAGVPVRLTLTGDPMNVPTQSQRAAYRLVEEALAMAHGRRGRQVVDVCIEVVAGDLRVHASHVGETGSDPLPVVPFDPRVAGLHERVALLGGELRTRLDDDGGFELEARLPSQDRGRDGRVLLPAAAGEGRAATDATTASVRRGKQVMDAVCRRPLLANLLIVATLVAVSIGEVLFFPEPFYDAERGWRGAVGLVAITATLLLRHRAPMAALLLAGGLEVMRDLLELRWTNGILLVMSIHIFTVASRRGPKVAAAGLVVAVGSHAIFLSRVIVGAFRTGGLGIPVTGAATLVSIILLRIVGMWVFAALAGRTLRVRDELNEQLADRVRLLMEHRDLQARIAIADERRRVARELHDIVAHGLTIMVLQSGVAGSMVRRDPGRAEDALCLVERLGEQAHGELEVLVELLSPEAPPLPISSPPRRVEDLVEDARSAGLDVELVVEGDRKPDRHLSLHVYRIVQEALTNAGKHASGSRIRVRVTYLDGGIEVEVANDAPLLAPLAGGAVVPGGGHGLVGMRERVGLFGGELEAGPRSDGGFQVRARIPEPAPA